MKSRLVKNNLLISILGVSLTVLISFVVIMIYMQKTMHEQVQSQTRLLMHILETTPEDNFAILYDIEGLTEGRVTYIYHDGLVTYDSVYDISTLDNYGALPEVKGALENDIAISQRHDETTGRLTYYCASKVGDGSVVRIAVTTSDIFGDVLLASTPLILAGISVIVSICFILSGKTVRKIVDSIENYDIENDEGELYEELSPFMNKIRNQNITINEQIQSITEEKVKLQSVFRNIKEGIIVCDNELNIIQTNPEARELFDITADNLNISDLTYSDELEVIMVQAVEGEVAQNVFAFKNSWFQCIASPNYYNGDNGAILIVMDITDQIEKERQRQQFTDNVTHELKTPLTSILGYSQLITNNIAKPEDITSFAGIIEENATLLLGMIDDIIRISSLESGDDFNKISLALNEIIHHAIRQQWVVAENKSVKITYDISPVVINADEGQMYQMAHNLVSNAVKYNKNGGEVYVSLEKQANYAVFTVKDTGIGIPSEDLDKIFERFYVVDKSRNKRISSAGLGLAIVKHIVKAHNGFVNVKSVLGKGTEFTVKLPLN
ncbi:MAG: PAS domain S-box protein [Oscillospiraceae bacterium]|nr:PAS domain S-box protein [Oscillospiraceae bacterium]